MRRKIAIAFSVLCGIILLGFVGYVLTIVSAFGGFDEDYSVSELKENFEENKKEIYELKEYFIAIVPKNRFVEIEFDNDNTLGRLGIKILDSTAGDPTKPIFLEWDLKINTERMDSIINPLGWTKETLETLKEKLDRANCIGVQSGEPVKISFQRSGMGMYSFNLFDKPVADSLKASYNDSCTYILVSNTLALEYGGGAIGPRCFYNLK